MQAFPWRVPSSRDFPLTGVFQQSILSRCSLVECPPSMCGAAKSSLPGIVQQSAPLPGCPPEDFSLPGVLQQAAPFLVSSSRLPPFLVSSIRLPPSLCHLAGCPLPDALSFSLTPFYLSVSLSYFSLSLLFSISFSLSLF